MITEFRDVDDLSPGDFELFVRDVFLAAGWSEAVITQVGKEYRYGDGGVDIFAYKRKRKFAIEVKQRHISITVDVKALNQLVTGAKLANTINMILVTNSYFTSEVKVRALRLGVELIDRDELQNLWVKKQSEIGRDIQPRKYQESVIDECLKLFFEGKNKFLIEMATGLGKTYTVAHILKRIIQHTSSKLKILFVAHQVEILLQSVTAFKNVFGIGNYSFSACFSGAEPENTDFVFASFDTLYGQLNKLKEGTFDLIVIDEAHHTPARTYSEVVKNFHPKLLIGLTATPYRVDNADVFKYFGGTDGHIGKFDLAWALRHNKLAFPKYMVMLDDIDQSRINLLKIGLSISDLDKRLFLHKRDEEVVRIIEDTIKEKQIATPKGIVFCRSIQHMRHLIQFFELGTATMVHSKMLDQERRDNVRKFRENDFTFILVCDLFNEGIDIPETNLLIFMRYTGSRTIWLQQLGRGLRKTKNKDYVHVLDFVGSLERLNEVRRLQEDIKKVKLDKSNYEKEPKDNVQSIHNSTLKVTYNQSAAQVLKLIEEQKYLLNTQKILKDRLQLYVRKVGTIPSIKEIEKILVGVTCDQISTHFGSYFGYLKDSAVPYEHDLHIFKDKIKFFIGEFVQKSNVEPSARAISRAFKYKSLVEFTEHEINELVGGEINLYPKKILNNISPIKQNTPETAKQIDLLKQKLQLENQQGFILKKYVGLIFNSKDIQKLNNDERLEIKEYFKSEFYFLKLIKSLN